MIIAFGTGWLFGPAAADSSLPGFDDSGLQAVTLPHTVAPLSWQEWDPAAWEREWVYRKHFDAFEVAGRRVFLDFGGALTHATVTLNGTDVGDYLGGYLPFSCEISDLLQPAGNVLAVRLDSGFNLNVPPDRPAPAVSTVRGLLAAGRDLPGRAAAGGAGGVPGRRVRQAGQRAGCRGPAGRGAGDGGRGGCARRVRGGRRSRCGTRSACSRTAGCRWRLPRRARRR